MNKLNKLNKHWARCLENGQGMHVTRAEVP
jgi:hypothetical protein